MLSRYKNIILNTLALILVLGGVVLAGEISNNSTPDSTTSPYTLEDVYQKLTDSNYTASPTHTLSPTVSTSTNSMYSLGDIYSAIPTYQILDGSTTTLPAGIYATTTLTDIEEDLVENNIASGTTMFGITGTFECTAP